MMEILEQDTLPCGCVMGTALENGVKTFFVRPHAMDCQYYLYAIEESKAQGKPVEKRYEI